MKQIVLHQKHLQANAKITDFQGWQVPFQYSNVQDEYWAVRTAAGLFDISWLGRIELTGAGAEALLQNVFTRNILKAPEGTACYGLMCNEAGFILNDGFIFHLSAERYLITTSPLNIDRIIQWLETHAQDTVRIVDNTQAIAQFALQGPNSAVILDKLAPSALKKIKPAAVKEVTLLDTTVVVSRTGYTGEHGYELFIPAERAEVIWDAIMNTGSESRILPCGFGSRDILRLEMGYPLYGNELDETRNPIEAGLKSVVDCKKEFIGKDAVQKAAAEKADRTLVGFELSDKILPKSGGIIFSENREIGMVTSSGHSPHVRKAIGLGYVFSRYAKPGLEVEIESKEHEIAAKIVVLPFYRKK